MTPPHDARRRPVLGVSLKMYFGHAQTLTWTRQITELVRNRPEAAEVFVMPSFPSVPATIDLATGTGVSVGAQDLAADDTGAQTGEVSGSVLAELGTRFVEVGHAERRRQFGEDETVVAAKTATALRHGLVPVLCLGESEQRGPEAAAQECLRQLHSALESVRQDGSQGRLVVAYEPHWAIGAVNPAPTEHILEVCGVLRAAVHRLTAHRGSAVIYGGSAGPGLLTELADQVDGLFLGRFAHDPNAFAAVLEEAAALTSPASDRIGVSA